MRHGYRRRWRLRGTCLNLQSGSQLSVRNKHGVQMSILRVILQSATKHVKRFTAVWLVILVVNQVFIFGACFAPHCLAAALPHTLAIAAVINFFGFKRDERTGDTPADAGDRDARAAGHEKFETGHLALLALIPIGILLVVLVFAPSSSTGDIAAGPSVREAPSVGTDPDEVGSDERAPPRELLINRLAVASPASDQPAVAQNRKGRDGPYYNVDPRTGIFCEDADQASHVRTVPGVNRDGDFYCPCSTDMGCVLNNPHILEVLDEADEEQARVITSKAPKGASCANAVLWDEARQYAGQTVVVAGPMMKIAQRNDVRGRPMWIDVGAAYPDPNRLSLVIWGDSAKEFAQLSPAPAPGKWMCMVGTITLFDGSPQITLQYGRQLIVAE